MRFSIHRENVRFNKDFTTVIANMFKDLKEIRLMK
jgi:hypothetical protein